MIIRKPNEKIEMIKKKEDKIERIEKKLDKIIVLLKNKVFTVGCATTVDIEENNKKEI